MATFDVAWLCRVYLPHLACPFCLASLPSERGRIITGPMEKWTARFTLQNRVLYDTSAFELGGTLWLQILAFRCLSM